MIRVGIVGIGFMGWIHWLAYQRVAGISVTAICSRDPAKRSGDWTKIQGNFGPPGEQVDLSDIHVFSDVDEMLRSGKVDLVDVCLPPYLHAETVLASFHAGMHVFCEKPLALSTTECNKMVAASSRSGKQLLVGHVLPFFPEYQHAREVIDSGKYGKLKGGSFQADDFRPHVAV